LHAILVISHPIIKFIRGNRLTKYSMEVTITHENFTTKARLNESPVAQRLFRLLPIIKNVNAWQEEVYIRETIGVEDENLTKNVSEGTLAYWPTGKAICVFYGDTQPINAVNVIGEVDNPEFFKDVKYGDIIRLEK